MSNADDLSPSVFLTTTYLEMQQRLQKGVETELRTLFTQPQAAAVAALVSDLATRQVMIGSLVSTLTTRMVIDDALKRLPLERLNPVVEWPRAVLTAMRRTTDEEMLEHLADAGCTVEPMLDILRILMRSDWDALSARFPRRAKSPEDPQA